MEDEPTVVCLACGEPIEDGLRFTASLRCADCRDQDARLDADLVDVRSSDNARA